MADKLQGKPADRAAEKSIIDPSVSASHSTRHLRNPPTTRPIFGAFRHVRVIRRRARHICIEDSFRQSKVGKGEREMDRVPQGKRCPRCCMTFLAELSFRFLKNESSTLSWSGGRSMKNCTLLADFGIFFLESPLPQQRIREENVGTRFESK